MVNGHDESRQRSSPIAATGQRRARLRQWVLTSTLVSGVAALIWLLLRTGNKPSRITYPCQQAALATAINAFGVPLVIVCLATRRGVRRLWGSPAGLTATAFAALICIAVWSPFSLVVSKGPPLAPPVGYEAQVFHVSDCPHDPVGTHFEGLDRLIALMGREGLKFYRDTTESLISGSEGIVGADDVVVIKINYQWAERGGSNVDVLRGLVQRIVEHPAGFTGEIVICENTQFASIAGFDRSQNNAQDIGRSPHDVVVEYEGLGTTISHFAWTAIRHLGVDEYADGDLASGYVVHDYDSTLQGRVSYPKFQTTVGTYISLKHGIWDPGTGTYDRERLKFINLPVLKSHHSTYGVTACVKNYMGVVTTLQSTNAHYSMRYGLLGELLAEIQLADLNLLDAIWVNANPFTGPACSYVGATRRDELVASVDPVAADRWAASNILIPAFLDEGFTPPWPSPTADPDDPDSDFREYLDNSMDRLLQAGLEVTQDPASIVAYSWDGAVSEDCNQNGVPDAWELSYADCNQNGVLDECDIAAGTSLDLDGDGVPDECCPDPFLRGELNGDGTVDVADAVYLLSALFASGPPIADPEAADVNGDAAVDLADAIYLLTYLFAGGPEPPPPFPVPGCA